MDFLSHAVQIELKVVYKAKDETPTLRVQVVALLLYDLRARLIGQHSFEPRHGGIGIAAEDQWLDKAGRGLSSVEETQLGVFGQDRSLPSTTPTVAELLAMNPPFRLS